MAAVKARAAVDVVTEHLTFSASPDLLLATPDGWSAATARRGAREIISEAQAEFVRFSADLDELCR
ncbi:hypothetical protein [Streptomyces zaomyceticus]|uniref:hypothetical protein n=1 Tax=Streptomyces zaomyceticus TaxID=68286 RepID=UPI002E245374